MHAPVNVSLEELDRGVSHDKLNEAFGPDSLGIIVVEDLPPHFKALRLEVLKSASILANQPPEILKQLESDESHWLVGWSCGKETLASSGKPDLNKGSFYVNCAFHKDEQLEGPGKELVEQFPEHRAYTSSNIWPPAKEGLETFKALLKQLCNLIIDIAEKVAVNCDAYISKTIDNYDPQYLYHTVKDSTCTKARLLHYFPCKDGGASDDDWCGEHLDHSCLTGLTSALFLDESQGLTYDLPRSPDHDAGLYIRNRHNEVVKVNIPSDCLAFQTGSTLQEVSRGKFKAVPHYVRGTSLPSIARNTLAVFCQPDLDQKVNDNENFAEYAARIINANH